MPRIGKESVLKIYQKTKDERDRLRSLNKELVDVLALVLKARTPSEKMAAFLDAQAVLRKAQS